MKALREMKLDPEETLAGTAAGDSQPGFDFGPLPPQFASRCRQTAALSIVPGLGQLRNGEIAKGALFLGVTITNVVLIFAICFAEKIGQPLSALSAAFHRQPNWLLVSPLQTNLLAGPVLFIYAAVLAAFVAYAVRDAYDHAAAIVRSGQALPKACLNLPEATSGSYLVHFLLVAMFALILILFVSPQQTHNQVTVIELVKQPTKEAHKANPAPRRLAPKKPTVVKPLVKPQPVIHPPLPVKVEKPKPQPVAVAIPTTEPTPLQTAPVEAPPAPPQTAPVPATDSGGSGNAAPGTGSGEGEADVDMGPYMRALQQRIKVHWFPPKGNENKRIKVSFTVYKDGHIAHLKLISSSGVSMADDAAMQAVQEASPYATLPDGVGENIDINFTFDYHVFGGR